jgi:hypothetical protein
LFWTTVQGSVPTDDWVVFSIIKPQSQMSMEDTFCMMTPSDYEATLRLDALHFNVRVDNHFKTRRLLATDSRRKT